MSRVPDWQPRLMLALAEGVAQPFAWGEHDCASGAARVADAITSAGYLARLRNAFPHRTAKQALLAIRDGGGLQPLVTQFLGRQPIPWGQAQQGDLILLRDLRDHEVLGICEGMQVICAGVGPLPMSRAICAWRID